MINQYPLYKPGFDSLIVFPATRHPPPATRHLDNIFYFRRMITPALAKNISPARQALACAVFSLTGMVLCHFAFRGGAFEFMAAFTGVVLYSMMNCVISVFHESFIKYTWPSWWIFAVLLVSLLLAARLISGISIWTLGEYRMMLGSIVVFYMVTSILVRLIRTIWEFAEEDEN